MIRNDEIGGVRKSEGGAGDVGLVTPSRVHRARGCDGTGKDGKCRVRSRFMMDLVVPVGARQFWCATDGGRLHRARGFLF